MEILFLFYVHTLSLHECTECWCKNPRGRIYFALFDVVLFIYLFFPWQITFSARKAETLPVTEMAPTELLSRRHSP